MKTIIYQDKNLKDYQKFCKIIEKAEKDLKNSISEILYFGENKGSDLLCKQYARDKNIKLVACKAEWNNIHAEGANVKERKNPWTKDKEKYNANAGFQRNEQMINSADAVIIIDVNSAGCINLLKLAKNNNLNIYINMQEELVEGEKIYF